jgi:hypothetical protein
MKKHPLFNKNLDASIFIIKTQMHILLLSVFLILTSCSKDDGVGYQKDQGPPEASAKVILLGQPVSTEPTVYQSRANTEITLTGKDSDSEYSPILEFIWEQIDSSGYPVQLIERNNNTYSFNAPNVTAPTQLQFRLTITDANGKKDEDVVYINIIPADDADNFLKHPGERDNKFYLKAVLDDTEIIDTYDSAFSFDIITIAHWIRRDGSNDQLEINRKSINGVFPANFAPTLNYDGINDPRNPVFIIDIPHLDADDINLHFEKVERERRVERYLIDDIVLETKIELKTTNGKNFGLYALTTVNPENDLNLNIIDLSSLAYDGPTSAGKLLQPRQQQHKILDTSETSISLSVTKLLAAMGLESYITASNYYQLLDPTGEFEKLEGWFKYAGFKDNNGNWIATDAAHALYVNNYDLGFARDMYSRKDENGNVYSFVVNYPTIESGINKLGEFALVAMEYSDNPDPLGTYEKIVKFYAYIYDEREGGFVRAKSLNFDGRGEKYVPGSCTGCHQGLVSGKQFLDVADADLNAAFLPWDIDAFLFAQAEDPKFVEPTLNKANFSKATLEKFSRESQEEQIRQLNLHALSTYGANPSRFAAGIELIHGWYGDTSNSLPSDELPESTFNEDYVQPGWASESDLYLNVYANNCRICHTFVNSSSKNFDNYVEFRDNSRLIEYVYERGMMPLARLSMDRFWSSINGGTSSAELLKEHLQGLAKTVPERTGLPVPAFTILPDGIGIATIDDTIIINAANSRFANSYIWELTPPFGSSTVLASNNSPITSFKADTPGGDYNIELTIYNAAGEAESISSIISIEDRVPVSECITANPTSITASGALDNIPIVSELSISLGDGGVYISDVLDGTYGTATIDIGNQTISYQLNNPFNRGIDTIYYQVSDADGSTSATNNGCDNGANNGYAAITINSTPTGNLNPGSLSATRDSTNDTHEIDLIWSAPTGITAESYNVYIVGDGTPLANVSAPTTSYTHSGLTPNTTYNYEVTSVVASAESLPSTAASTSTLALTPVGPLTASAASTSQINLGWSAPTGTVSSYKIYRDGSYLNSTSSTTYSDTGLTSGQSYSYEVSALDSLPQESVKVGPTADTVTPQAPSTLILSPGSNDAESEIQLNWTAPGGTRDHYCIYRDGVSVGSTTSTNYLNTGLASYHLYEYYVTAIASSTASCMGTESANSNTESLRTDTSGTTEPTLDSATVDVTNDASEIDLSWTPSTSYTATGYKVYRDSSVVATLGAVTAYSDTGLSYNTSYSYEVTALYDPGDGSTTESALSNTITRSTDNLIPSGVGGSATSTTEITVTWSAPAANVDTNGYTVYRDGGLAGTSNGTSFNDTGLTEGTTYSYTVTATQGAQTSTASSAGNISTNPTAPSAPTFGAQTTSSLVVNWAAPDGDNGYTYDVEYSLNGSTWVSLLSGTSSTATTHTGRTAGTLYYYHVRAIKNSIASDYSSSVSKSTLPNVPTSVSAADATSASQIAITWAAPASGNVDTYSVFRDGSSIATGIAVTNYTDTGRTPGTSHSYTVKAVANSETSAASSASTGYTAPNNVTIGTATATSKSAITLTWSAATGASSYNIYDNSGTFVKNASGTSTSITGLTSYTTYTYKIKALSSDSKLSLSFSSTANDKTFVSFSTDIGGGAIGTGGTCTACHDGAFHQGTSAGADISVNFPTCIITNGVDCSGDGSMPTGNDEPDRILIRDWVSEGSNRSN